MTKHIEILEKVSQRPNGDRDHETHPHSTFTVVVVDTTGKKEKLKRFEHYDHWWTHFDGTRADALGKAQKYARKMARVIGCDVVTEPDPRADKICALKNRIKKLQQELRTLEVGRIINQKVERE